MSDALDPDIVDDINDDPIGALNKHWGVPFEAGYLAVAVALRRDQSGWGRSHDR